jgi:UDP-glucose 4-epimerase
VSGSSLVDEPRVQVARRRVVVIGGGGFIGRAVTGNLVAAGREVTALGRRAPAAVELPPEVRYLQGDYGDLEVLRRSLEGADAVVDLAYSTVPQTSFDDPVFDIVSNLPASVQLLQEAMALGVGRVLLVSSGGTVYGVASSLPIREDHPTNPISPYGITKLTIEKYAGMFGRTRGLDVVIVRPGNAYGEGQRPFSGQGFIGTAIHSVVQGRPVSIFGPSGTIRDYVHVSDIAAGIVAALDRGAAGEIYNLGSGEGRSNVDVLSTLKPLAADSGYAVSTSFATARSFDVPANVLHSGKLGDATGWRPTVGFAEGLARVWMAAVGGVSRGP